MKVIQLPQGAGKTSKLLQMMMSDEKLYYVAPTHRQAEQAQNMSREITGAPIARDRFLCVDQFRRNGFPGVLRGRPSEHLRLVVDNLEGVLHAFMLLQVKAATVTGDPSINIAMVPAPNGSPLALILEERARQIEKGYDAEHDDASDENHLLLEIYNLSPLTWNTDDRRRYFTQVAALAIAGLEKLDREDSR